jgi:hypothetical protein
VRILPSDRAGKKLKAVFDTGSGRSKTVHFGAAGMSDYTIHHDSARKDRYIARHAARENWHDPMTPGALSRWILWNKRSLAASVADYRRRFNLG